MECKRRLSPAGLPIVLRSLEQTSGSDPPGYFLSGVCLGDFEGQDCLGCYDRISGFGLGYDCRTAKITETRDLGRSKGDGCATACALNLERVGCYAFELRLLRCQELLEGPFDDFGRVLRNHFAVTAIWTGQTPVFGFEEKIGATGAAMKSICLFRLIG